jgi:hypothetical protein
LEEFKAAEQLAKRRELTRAYVLCAILVVIAVGLHPLALMFKSSDDYAVWFVQNVGGPGLAVGLGFGVCTLLAVFIVSLTRFLSRPDRRDLRLYCPHCRRRLQGAVAFSGLCAWCGARALEMPGSSSDQPQMPLMTVTEFNSAFRANVKRVVVLMAFLLVTPFIYLILVGLIVSHWREPISDWFSVRFRTDRPQDIYGPLAVLPSIAIILGMAGLFVLRERRAPRASRLKCPQCQNDLFQPPGPWLQPATVASAGPASWRILILTANRPKGRATVNGAHRE